MDKKNFEIFYTDVTRNFDIEQLLFQIQAENLENMYQITENPVFRLYGGTLKFSNNSKAIYLLELKVLSGINLNKILSSLLNSKYFLNENPHFHYFFLKRVGYFFNEMNQTFNLVYLNNGNQIVDLSKMYEGKDWKIKILMYFYKFLEFINKCHEKMLYIGFFHPDSIFFSRITGFQLIDYSFSDLFCDIEFENIYPNTCYFGYFDLSITSKKDLHTKKSLDIILVTLFLGYLFSFNREGNNNKNIYCRLVHNLQHDFLTNDKNFTRFLSNINDDEIRLLLSQVLNLKYEYISPIVKFTELFKKILNSHLEKVKCYTNCKSPHAEKMNFICDHFLCKECYKHHLNCERSQDYSIIKENDCLTKDTDKEIDECLRLRKLIPELTKKSFFSYYLSLVQIRFQKIDIEHQKINNFSKLYDDKLNSMINFTEKSISSNYYKLADKVIKKRKDVDTELSSILESIEKKENRYTLKAVFKSVFEDKTNNNFDIIDNPRAIEILTNDFEDVNNYNEFQCIFIEFSDMMWVLCNLLQNAKIYKSNLNNHLSTYLSYEILSTNSTEYFNYISKTYINEMDKIINGFSDNLVEFFRSLNIDDIKKNNIFDFYPETLNTFVATLDIKDNNIILYNTSEKKCTVNKVHFRDNYYPEPACMLKKSGWVNMVDKLFVTGGIYKNKKGEDVISKRGYYIKFTPYINIPNPNTSKSNTMEKNELNYQAFRVRDMNYERINHCLVKVNEYYIVVISGRNTETCEMYNLLRDEWTILASLESPYYNTAAIVCNNLDVYIFFGLVGDLANTFFSKDIFRLRLFSTKDEKWEKIQYTFDYKRNICLHSLIFKNDKIYILGGKLEGENNYSDAVLEYYIKTAKIEFSKLNLGQRLCFFEPAFVKTKNEDYGLYSANNYFIHMKI